MVNNKNRLLNKIDLSLATKPVFPVTVGHTDAWLFGLHWSLEGYAK